MKQTLAPLWTMGNEIPFLTVHHPTTDIILLRIQTVSITVGSKHKIEFKVGQFLCSRQHIMYFKTITVVLVN